MGKGIPRPEKSQALKWDLHLFGAWRLCWFDFLALRLLEVFEEETRKVQTFEMTLGAIFYSHVFKNVKKLYLLQVFWEYLKWFSARKKQVFLNFGGSDNYVSLNHELQVLVQIVEAFASPHQLWFYQDFFCVDFGPKIHPIEKEQHPKQTVMFGQVHIMRTRSSSLS